MAAITHIAADIDALSTIVADEWVAQARQAIDSNGRFYTALAGGRTPRRLYETLASPPFARRVAWEHVHVFFGDERCVPPDHTESNYALARDALLARVAIPPAQIHRIKGELPPEEAAAEYALELAQLPQTVEGIPRFDLVLLGLGADGHVASLFPASPALDERRRVAMPVLYAPKDQPERWRISLTLPVLNAARHLFVLVSGEEKAAIVHQVFSPPTSAPPLPAELLRPNGDIDWYMDAGAAAHMPYIPLHATE